MKLTFPGAGNAVTSLDRYHASLLIEYKGHGLLIDAGDGISRALLACGCEYGQIDYIIISHFHPDHLSGLATLITQFKQTERKKPVTLYVHKSLTDTVEKYLNIFYRFPEYLPFELNILGFNENEELTAGGISVLPAVNGHVHNKHNLEKNIAPFVSCSFKISAGNRTVIYTSDIGSKDDLTLFNESRADIFITEVTHIKAEDLKEFYETRKPGQIIITHLGPEEEEKINGFLKGKGEGMPVKLAYDGMKLLLAER